MTKLNEVQKKCYCGHLYTEHDMFGCLECFCTFKVMKNGTNEAKL